MFDSPYHKNPLLAGMIGFQKQLIPNIHDLVMDFTNKTLDLTPNIDETFLKNHVYSIFKKSGFTHLNNQYTVKLNNGFIGEQIHPSDIRVSSNQKLCASFAQQ